MSLRKYLTVTAFSAAALFGGDARGADRDKPGIPPIREVYEEDISREAEATTTSQDYRPSTEDRLDELNSRIDNLERGQRMYNTAGTVVDCLFGVAIGCLIAENLKRSKKKNLIPSDN